MSNTHVHPAFQSALSAIATPADTIREASVAADKLLARVKALEAALQEIRDMHDGEEDTIDGDYGIPEPNRAMRVNSIIDAVL